MRATQRQQDDARPAVGDMLNCGHVLAAQPAGSCTTGYAQTRDGRYVCYACADEMQRDDMDRDGKITAYLSSDGLMVGTWTGGHLATVLSTTTGSAGGFCARETITRVWARDRHGRLWYGRGLGRGMYMRLRRSADTRAGRQ